MNLDDEKCYISLKSSDDNLINNNNNKNNNTDNKKEDITSKINPNNETSSIIGEKLADSNKTNLDNVLNQLDKEYSSCVNINKTKNSKSSITSTASSSPSNTKNNANIINNCEQNCVNELNSNNNNNDNNDTVNLNKEDTTTSSSASLNNNNNIKNNSSDNNNTSDSNNYNNLTFNNNINNTINSRYKQFEKKKRNCSITSNTMENNNNNNSTQSNTTPINSAISVNTNLPAEPYDFTLRINKLRFIDDSASSTALTSPAESMNHLYLIGLNGSMSSLNRTKNNSKYKKSLLNSSNYPPQIATTTAITANELESHTTSSSRTISLPPSTNCSISNSASSTPAFNNPRLNQSRCSSNRMAMIKRQANVKSSTDTLNSDLDQINTGANKINNISTSNNNNNNNNNQKSTINLSNSPIVKLNKTSSTPGVQHQHELLTDNLALYRTSNQSNQVKLLQQKMQTSSTTTSSSTPTSSSPTTNGNQLPQYKQVIKNADGAGDNMEDDEEIKNIIMHNLNEKLKSNNAQRQLINYNRYKHSNKINSKNVQNQQQSSASSIVSTTTEIESSSSEYEHHHQQQQKLVHSKNYHSDTTTISVPNECSSDSSNNNSFRLKPSNIIKPCKYCKSNTKIGACAADSSASNCSSTNNSYLNVKAKNNANLIMKQAKLDEKFKKITSKKTFSSTTSTANSSNNEGSYSIKNNNNTTNNNSSISSSYHYYHGYSPVKYQERVYAYDNFDCINECLEENEQQYINQLNQKRIMKEENSNNNNKNTNNSKMNQNQDEEVEDDDDEKCFTSILVEDGFIRMSSPVAEEDSSSKQLNQSSLSSIPSSSLKNNSKMVKKIINIENNQATAKPNFPNVGSSPISEQFLNSNSSSDNEDTIENNNHNEDDQYQNLDGIIMHNRKIKISKNINSETLSDDEQILVQIDDENVQEDDEEIEEEEFEGELEEDEEDDIENLLEQEGEEIEEEEEEEDDDEDEDEEVQSDEEVEEEEESSDENEQLIEDCEDQYELEQDMMLENESLNDEILRQYEKAIEQEIEANKNLSPPKKIKNMQHIQLDRNYYMPSAVQNKSMQKSIMKNRQDQSYAYQSPIYASLENSENVTNHSLSTTSSQVSSSYNYSSIDNSSTNLINKMASMTIESSSSSQVTTTTTTTTSHAKPKVRFNLDINYEKEREWNRVNKIIGDASKSQIEWTQEVEV